MFDGSHSATRARVSDLGWQAHHPVHVTLRIVAGVPSLRDWARFSELRAALARGQERFGFRLVHYSVQSDYVHLSAEARDRRALSRGMQGLSVRLARAVNRTLGRRGRVFADRYHARALKTPRATHFALRSSPAEQLEKGPGCAGWSKPPSISVWVLALTQ